MTGVKGADGEMSCFGGITPGVKFEKQGDKVTLPYKENIYLEGKAQTVTGTLEIRPGKAIDKEKGVGSYTEGYKMVAQNTEGTVKLTRTITLETNYVYEKELRQTTKVTTPKSWAETIIIEGKTYKLDSKQSSFSKSILEEATPGVLYYRGDLHYESVYKNVSQGDARVTVSVSAPIYGYEQAYAKTETHKRTIRVKLEDHQGYVIEEVPSFTVYKELAYGVNEPTAISMAGNYKEITRGEGVLMYQMKQGAPELYGKDKAGTIEVSDSPSFQQLSLPTTLHLKGHPAESQIKKMYSLKIFEENPLTFATHQIVTRKEYIAMLVKAMGIPLPEPKKGRGKQEEEKSPFMDLKTSDPYYPYAKAAYEAGLIEGTLFQGNHYLTREMLYVWHVKALGLQRLGLSGANYNTSFIDDAQIASWAKPAIQAASRLGLITTTNGYLFPKKKVTQAECATFLDQLLIYMRYDLQKDYSEYLLF